MGWNYPYFREEEVACKCGCGTLPLPAFMDWLVTVREEYGIEMIVDDAARCAKHNATVVGAVHDSAHVLGKAADIAVQGGNALHLLYVALKHGATGIGVQQKGDKRFLHLDIAVTSEIGTRPTIWSY